MININKMVTDTTTDLYFSFSYSLHATFPTLCSCQDLAQKPPGATHA